MHFVASSLTIRGLGHLRHFFMPFLGATKPGSHFLQSSPPAPADPAGQGVGAGVVVVVGSGVVGSGVVVSGAAVVVVVAGSVGSGVVGSAFGVVVASVVVGFAGFVVAGFVDGFEGLRKGFLKVNWRSAC